MLTIRIGYFFFETNKDSSEFMQALAVMETVGIFLYIAEMVLHLNTAYYESGRLEKTRIKIFQNYKSKSFYYDILSLIALMQSSLGTDKHYLLNLFSDLLVCLKIFSMRLIKENLEGMLFRNLNTAVYEIM